MVISVIALVGTLLTASPGLPAPDFSAPNQDGKLVRLSDFRGKSVLLFFYPKDGTPGCTKQVCSLRDNYDAFRDLGVVVLGISRQNEKSHRAFKQEHGLPFDLLVDKDGEIAKMYGVGMMPIIGLHRRESVLISADGNLVRHYTNVDPQKHSAMVLEDLAARGDGGALPMKDAGTGTGTEHGKK